MACNAEVRGPGGVQGRLRGGRHRCRHLRAPDPRRHRERRLTQANKLKADNTLKAFLELVDGKHASTLAEVRVVSSVGSNVLWGGTIANSATENETIGQFLMRSGLTWRTREGIDGNTAANDYGAYIGLQRGIAGAGVAAVWSSGELIRDPVPRRGKG